MTFAKWMQPVEGGRGQAQYPTPDSSRLICVYAFICGSKPFARITPRVPFGKSGRM
jgi:hypothetical protein